MSESALVPAEIEAIWAVLREPGAKSSAAPVQLPSGELISLVFERAKRALCAAMPGRCAVTFGALRERSAEAAAWERAAGMGAAPALALRASPEIVERCAMLRCGDRGAPHGRAPSPTARRLFDGIGLGMLAALTAAWRSAGLPALEVLAPEPIAPTTWRATVPMRWEGAAPGSCELVLSASALAALVAAEHRTQRELARVLTSVEVPVVVELLRRPAPQQLGARWELPAESLDRVPIFVGGVLKAWGLPVVQRGARAVQVTELSRPARGTRESAFQESPVSTARSSVCDPIDSEPASEDSAVCGGIIDEPTGSRSAIALPPPTDDEHAMLAALRDTLGDVPAQVTIELGRVTLPLGELLHLLAPGCIIPLERSALAPLEVRVSDKLVARAEAVAHGERYEVRITELVVGAR